MIHKKRLDYILLIKRIILYKFLLEVKLDIFLFLGVNNIIFIFRGNYDMSFYRNPQDVGIMSRAGAMHDQGGFLEPGTAPRGILEEGILRPGLNGIYR